MALLVVRFFQNMITNYSSWLKTERKTIISNLSDFTKIAPTVPPYKQPCEVLSDDIHFEPFSAQQQSSRPC